MKITIKHLRRLWRPIRKDFVSSANVDQGNQCGCYQIETNTTTDNGASVYPTAASSPHYHTDTVPVSEPRK